MALTPSSPLGAALATAVLLLSASCSNTGSAETPSSGQNAPPNVAVENVTRTNLSHSLSLTAEFIPYQEVDVMAKVAGYIRRINVDIGDRVHTGQILATLEVPEMNDDLERAAATVQRSDAEIERAQDDVARAKAAHEMAHLSSQRLQGVAQQRAGLVAQQEIDNAKSQDLASEAQVSATRSSLLAAEQQRAITRAELARFKTLYNYTNVTAPFDGVITKRYGNTGSMIQAGISSQTQAMPVVRLSQNHLLRLMLPVPESAVAGIHLGQKVEVHVPSLGRSFPGKVARFSDQLNSATRTMETEVDVPNPSLILIPGMFANADLQLETRPQALSIPVIAVDTTSPSPRVYKISAQQTVEIVPVSLGLETPSRVEVLSGLREGDQVVVGPRAALKAGDKVHPEIIPIVQPNTEP